MITESLVENLLKEITFITCRSKVIKETICKTNNNNLKVRLRKEYRTLLSRLENIHMLGLDILNLTKDQISFAALLVENCKRIRLESHNNRELFFT
tara:strand:- start:125 stop:412 length:288 start_codon:yes stop_codon:yes gene_type:complete